MSTLNALLTCILGGLLLLSSLLVVAGQLGSVRVALSSIVRRRLRLCALSTRLRRLLFLVRRAS